MKAALLWGLLYGTAFVAYTFGRWAGLREGEAKAWRQIAEAMDEVGVGK